MPQVVIGCIIPVDFIEWHECRSLTKPLGKLWPLMETAAWWDVHTTYFSSKHCCKQCKQRTAFHGLYVSSGFTLTPLPCQQCLYFLKYLFEILRDFKIDHLNYAFSGTYTNRHLPIARLKPAEDKTTLVLSIFWFNYSFFYCNYVCSIFHSWSYFL